MIPTTDAAYIAGLFDGEGCITYKQYMRQRKGQKKAYPTWSIRMEIAMTDKSVLIWLHEVLGVGTLGEKRYRTKYTVGWLIWPFAHVKLSGVQKIIEHYSKEIIMNGKVVDLEKYKQIMNLEWQSDTD